MADEWQRRNRIRDERRFLEALRRGDPVAVASAEHYESRGRLTTAEENALRELRSKSLADGKDSE